MDRISSIYCGDAKTVATIALQLPRQTSQTRFQAGWARLREHG